MNTPTTYPTLCWSAWRAVMRQADKGVLLLYFPLVGGGAALLGREVCSVEW
jgi:hypothetical protein